MQTHYDSSEYVPQHHIPVKQLSVKKIRGQIGRRLDGEQQPLRNADTGSHASTGAGHDISDTHVLEKG